MTMIERLRSIELKRKELNEEETQILDVIKDEMRTNKIKTYEEDNVTFKTRTVTSTKFKLKDFSKQHPEISSTHYYTKVTTKEVFNEKDLEKNYKELYQSFCEPEETKTTISYKL
jgi:Zn-dependent metalloprotease